MAESAVIFILPVISAERFRARGDTLVHRDGVDLANQRLAPSADRRNVVELWRAKAELDIARHMAAIEQEGRR